MQSGREMRTSKALITNRNGTSLSTAVAAQIEQLITDGDLEEAAEALRQALRAVVRVRKARVPGMGVDYEDVPDHKIRLTAVKLMLEARYGRRAHVTTEDVTPPETRRATLLDQIQNDPDFRNAMQRIGAQYVASLPAPEAIDIDLDG